MTDFLYTHSDASKADGMEAFVNRIVKDDKDAREQMSEIWSQLRYNGNFNYDFFEERIDAYAATLEESQKLNFVRWPILNQSVQKGQKIFGSYEGEVNNLKSYLKGRFPKLDTWLDLHEVAAIDAVIPDIDNSNAPVEIYDLSGRKVNTQQLNPGIYIRRQGSEVTKILVR